MTDFSPERKDFDQSVCVVVWAGLGSKWNICAY